MTYDILSHAERIAGEAERLQRFEDRGYAHLFIHVTTLPATDVEISFSLVDSFPPARPQPPRRLSLWRRVCLRLLRAEQ